MKYNKFFISMFILVILGGVIALAPPILISVWGNDDVGFALNRIFILLVILISSTIIQLLFVYARERFAASYNLSNMEKQLDVFYNLRYSYINEQGPTNILERIVEGVNNTYMFMTGDFIKIWSSILIIIVVLIMVFINNIILFGLLLLIIPVNYFGYKLLNKELAERTEKGQIIMGQGFQTMLSVLSQVDYLKQIDNYDPVREFLHPEIDSIYKTMAKVNVLAHISSSLISSINEIAKTMIMIIIVYDFIGENMSPYVLILYTVVLPLFFTNLNFITNANLSRRNMNASNQFLNQLNNNLEIDGDIEIGQVKKITFNVKELKYGDVSLKYDVHEEFNVGDIVWIRGESGTGKSSLVKLLPKFQTSENILINEVPLEHIKNASIRREVDYISQQIPIIRGTLRENLFFGMKWSKELEEKLKDTILLKQLLETKSMDTMIEENGTNLSGGEKQKIAALRAFNSRASVMVLDEITSSIDNENAIEIYKTLLEDSNNRITIIISHDDLPKEFSTRTIKIGD